MAQISFAYPSNPTKLVLHPSSFSFPAGSLTFLVGRSGSGKSTLGNLLVRFYEPLTGRIRLDGRALSTLDPAWLRRRVLLVQQASTVFAGMTFAANVALGAPIRPEDVAPQAVADACTMALLQSTIAGLPQGLDTVLSSGGLSGGQKKRLALARARLRDPEVLVLDELTSELDPTSRSLIMEAVRVWRRGRTTIVITHEVAQIADGDLVYVMEDGRVVQQGRRDALLREEAGGLFATLVAAADDGDAAGAGGAGADGGASSSSSSASDEDSAEEESADELVAYAPATTRFSLLAGLPRRQQQGTQGGSIMNVMSMRAGQRQDARLLPSPALAHREPWAAGLDGSMARAEKPAGKKGRKERPRSLDLITQRGNSVQTSRRPGVRQRRALEGDKLSAALAPPASSPLDRFLPDSGPVDLDEARKADEKERARMASLLDILKTVWPNLNQSGRVHLLGGLGACLVAAGANPAFSYVFAKLLASLWTVAPGGAASGMATMSSSAWAGYLGLVGLIDALATFASFLLLELAAQCWIDTVRQEAFAAVLTQPKDWFDKATRGKHQQVDAAAGDPGLESASASSSSRIIGTLDTGAGQARKLLGTVVPVVLTASIMVLASVAWALALRWDLALVALACSVPVTLGVTHLNAASAGFWESRCAAAADRADLLADEACAQVRVVRALGLETRMRARHGAAAAAAYRLGLARARWVGAWTGLAHAVPFCMAAVVFFYAARVLARAPPGGGTGDTATVLQVVNLLLFSFGVAASMLAGVPQVAAAQQGAVRLLHYASLPPPGSRTGGRRADDEFGLPRVRGTPLPIVLRNLRFTYPSRPLAPVLRSVSLTLQPGTCTALVGASGCGKSTLAALLLRLYDPDPDPDSHAGSTHDQAPSLSYNGVAGPAAAPSSLLPHLAYVPQHPVLFPGSVAHNILYGVPADSPRRTGAHAMAAARRAGLHDFVASLPDGYGTAVGEGGTGLSGGQAQRLGIARALARGPPVLVLDEPTSALDAEGAEGVRAAVRALVREGREAGEAGMAVVVVTHSTEMMRVADRVVVLEQGCVVEEGGYDELVARRGRFAQLVGGGVWMGERPRRRPREARRGLRPDKTARAQQRRAENDSTPGGGAGGALAPWPRQQMRPALHTARSYDEAAEEELVDGVSFQMVRRQEAQTQTSRGEGLDLA